MSNLYTKQETTCGL